MRVATGIQNRVSGVVECHVSVQAIGSGHPLLRHCFWAVFTRKTHESRVIRTSDETEEENRNEGEWFFCVSCNFISYTSYYLVSTIPIDTHVYDATKEFVLRDFPVFVTALLSTNSITAWLISFVTYSASKQKINTIMSYNSASVAATSGNDNTRFKSSNHSFSIIITTTTTIVVCGTCCLYQFIVWRARKRSRTIVQQIMDSIQNEDGPLVRVFVTEQPFPLFLCMTLFSLTGVWILLSQNNTDRL